MSKTGWNFASKRCYTLAANWLRLRRLARRLNAGERIARWLLGLAGSLVGAIRRNRVIKESDLWEELFRRFDSAFRRVLIASNCDDRDVGTRTTACVVEFMNLVDADPANNRVPQMMWRACKVSRPVPAAFHEALENMFHLRALLDEMPYSQSREKIRTVLFPTREQREELSTKGISGTALYAQNQSSLNSAYRVFALFLHRERQRVERLTRGGVPAAKLSSQRAAFRLIVDSAQIGVD